MSIHQRLTRQKLNPMPARRTKSKRWQQIKDTLAFGTVVFGTVWVLLIVVGA